MEQKKMFQSPPTSYNCFRSAKNVRTVFLIRRLGFLAGWHSTQLGLIFLRQVPTRKPQRKSLKLTELQVEIKLISVQSSKIELVW